MPTGGSTAVVCGSTGGLGAHVVAALVQRGDHVIAVARSGDLLRDLAASHGGRVDAEVADLTREEEVEALWKRIDASGRVPKWLVNVTGGFRPGTVRDTKPDEYRQMLNLNLSTAWWSCREAAARMGAAGAGAIVNVAARSALVGGAGAAVYAVSKAAVVKLTQVLADELKDKGVRVNAILPATIDTPANRESMPSALMEKAVSPQAIAKVICFLCSESAAPITGALIPVYGRF